MSTRKTSLFYGVLIAVAGMAVGMVIASRLDLAPASSAQTVSVPSMNSSPITGPIDATTFRTIAKANAPAVVNIQTEVRQRGRDLTEYFGQGGDDLLRRFFGGDDPQATPQQRGRGRQNRQPQQQQDVPVLEGAGTGFVIDKAGYILTNNHVIDGAETIRVSLYGGERTESYAAKVVGHDTLTDSALIQLTEMPKRPLSEVRLGDSDQMQPGDWVMAIGNPFRLGHSVSVGVISGLGGPNRAFGVPGREQEMLQTDAAINPGNSGGPLLNIRGEVVGMNTAIYTDQRSANIGIGFATPMNTIRELLPQLRAGKIVRGVIGVNVSKDHITGEAAKAFGLPNASGALITTVSPSGPADKAGIQPGDVVVDYNGKPVKDSDSLVSMVVNTKPGTSVPVDVYRNNQKKTVNVTVGELDLDAEQARQARRASSTPEPVDRQPPETSFGMTLEPITPDLARRLELPANTGGAIVTDVDRNSPAANGGVAPNDVILEVNRHKVNNVSQVTKELQNVQPGQAAFLLVWRDGGNVFVTMTKH
jgi:serine protease Do